MTNKFNTKDCNTLSITQKIKRYINVKGLFIRIVSPRPLIRFIQRLNLNGLTGIEIGTWRGINALDIMNSLDMKKMYLIDNYLVDDEYIKDFKSSMQTTMDVNEAKSEAKHKLDKKKFSKKIVWIYQKSSEAVKEINEDIDFVYIDGNHAYKNVVEDISNYFNLVKVGGVIGGHDIEQLDVSRAVMEFAVKNNQQVYICSPDWWIVKK
jgi:hypothetical protein